ncbi:hypothetical protein HK405_001854 [Cladochytrium tenue]|nr:hypothetical protein HK405_001854 [Cladochytrium tenue]
MMNKARATTYESLPVELPEGFLLSPPLPATVAAAAAAAASSAAVDVESNASPGSIATSTQPRPSDALAAATIDWAATPLLANRGRFAAVLDGVLTPAECATLLQLAESSVPASMRSPESAWRPALVNVGYGREAEATDYRNSDRIVWDSQEVVNRIWERCCAAAPGLRERLAMVRDSVVLGTTSKQTWEFKRLNERMRVLRYGPGQFFRGHFDGSYETRNADTGARQRTLFTVQIYLNNSRAEDPSAALLGGATAFNNTSYRVPRRRGRAPGDDEDSRHADADAKLRVECKAGRVLIFQHNDLPHEGEEVLEGTKYTIRTDILYELI